MSRRAAAALAVSLLCACARAAPPGELRARLAALGHPNVVLLLCDTLRADWTTPYGFSEETTPELARWAARGVVFERTRAQSSWTKISVASLMTSLWPRSHGIREAQDGLAEGAVTLAEALRTAGYATYGIQTNGWLHQSFGFHQGFDRYVFPRGGANPRLPQPSIWPHADRVVEEATELIRGRDHARPFFLYLHFMDVHEYAAPPEFKSFGSDSKGAYLAAVRWVDDAVERVRKKLEDEGLLDETVLVFGADHGETFGEHGVHGHARNVLTPVVHVPLVIRLPFALEPVRVATQVRNLDLAPTLLELAGVTVPPGFEGSSLLPLVTGETVEGDRPSFATLGVPLFPDASVQQAVNLGEWTYARNAPAESETASEPGSEGRPRRARPVAPGVEYLFDRRVDPGENVNLVEREPAEAARLRAALDAHLRQPSHADALEKGVRIDPGIADRLRAMGYLR